MRRFFGYLAIFGLVFLLVSGAFTKIVEFGIWLFMLQYSGPETSIFGEIVVRVLTFAVTFGLVKIIFEAFGLFNSKIMSAAYWIISTIVSFILAYIVWTIEEHLLVIGIVLGIITVLIIIFFVVRAIAIRKKNKKSEE